MSNPLAEENQTRTIEVIEKPDFKLVDKVILSLAKKFHSVAEGFVKSHGVFTKSVVKHSLETELPKERVNASLLAGGFADKAYRSKISAVATDSKAGQAFLENKLDLNWAYAVTTGRLTLAFAIKQKAKGETLQSACKLLTGGNQPAEPTKGEGKDQGEGEGEGEGEGQDTPPSKNLTSEELADTMLDFVGEIHDQKLGVEAIAEYANEAIKEVMGKQPFKLVVFNKTTKKIVTK